MNESEITSEGFITLSREYLDDVMGDRKIRIRKQHYYIFAISNFIATQEYFLKKKITKIGRINRTEIIFNITDNANILPMLTEFYNSIKIKNKDLQERTIQDIQEKIKIIPTGIYDDEEYFALDLFHRIRNALSHAGKYIIKEKNGESIVSIILDDSNINKIDIPIELFDFIAFYINSYSDGLNVDDILQNYLIYKNSKDNKEYYNFESKTALDKIKTLVAKTQIRIHKKTNTKTKNMNVTNSETSYIDEVVDEFIYNYGKIANEILKMLNRNNINDEQKLQILLELNIDYRAKKRLASIKIDKSIENIKSMLRLDKKSASLYSHSIIIFTNRAEPTNTNAQEVIAKIRRIINEIIQIKIENPENMDKIDKINILTQYKHTIEMLLRELPNLIRINEHNYRNSIFHNNLEFKSKVIHFWNQKDNNNPNDSHTFDIYKTPEMYNSELKSIEIYNMNMGEMTIWELYGILSQYYIQNEIDEMINTLWKINRIDKELLGFNTSIAEFIENIDKKIKEWSNLLT